jgi:drug/metabolite transporter (DMT)-like permease
VGIACLGVLVMTYGDSGSGSVVEDAPPALDSDLPARALAEDKGQTGSLFGDLLGLLAGVLVGLYEVSSRYKQLGSQNQG